MIDLISPFARIPESFIGNNKKKIKKSKIKKSKPIVRLGKGQSNLAQIPQKPKPETKQKVVRATLNQKMCIYAICMKLYNDKNVAKEVSNRFGKSKDLASQKIQELQKIQRNREVLAK